MPAVCTGPSTRTFGSDLYPLPWPRPPPLDLSCCGGRGAGHLPGAHLLPHTPSAPPLLEGGRCLKSITERSLKVPLCSEAGRQSPGAPRMDVAAASAKPCLHSTTRQLRHASLGPGFTRFLDLLNRGRQEPGTELVRRLRVDPPPSSSAAGMAETQVGFLEAAPCSGPGRKGRWRKTAGAQCPPTPARSEPGRLRVTGQGPCQGGPRSRAWLGGVSPRRVPLVSPHTSSSTLECGSRTPSSGKPSLTSHPGQTLIPRSRHRPYLPPPRVPSCPMVTDLSTA